MRIVDVVATLSSRPTQVVPATPAVAGLAAGIADELRLGEGGDGGVRLVLGAAEDTSVVDALGAALDRSGGLGADETMLLLCDLDVDTGTIREIAGAVAGRELRLTDVIDISHPVWTVALQLSPGNGSADRDVEAELLLERWVTRRDRAGADAMARELDRRGERIDRLSSEVLELRERLTNLTATHEQLEQRQAGRDKDLVAARKEIKQLRGSSSYRLGHLLVRVAKNPALLLTLPARLFRRVRS